MADAHGRVRRRLAPIAAGLALTAPVSAAAAAPEGPELAAWLAQTTDLQSAHVALVGDGSVYSLEPLGGRLPTGEVIVLVRTEPLADDWGAAHGFQSWDAHLLIDCGRRQMRVIRSATYLQRNRGGAPTPEAPDHRAQTPKPAEPAGRLTAAACDPDFAWPLRRTAAAPATPTAAKTETPVAAPPPAAGVHAVQVARGPSEDGARRALKKARRALGAAASELQDALPVSRIPGDHIRYDARLEGFPTVAAARAACRTLTAAGQSCFPVPPPSADGGPQAIATS